MLGRRSRRRREDLKALASRQAAIAALGERALGGQPLNDLMQAAADAARRELGVDYASVFELTGDGRGLLVRAGSGFPEGVLGGVLAADPGELPMHALELGRAVAVADLSGDERVTPSPLERDLEVSSALAVPIAGGRARFGAVVVHAREPRGFGDEEAGFLRSLAHLIGLAAARSSDDEHVRHSEARLRAVASTTPALLWMTDPDGAVTYVNEAWRLFTGLRPGDELGDTFAASAHPEDRPELLMRWRQASRRRDEFRFEYRLRHAPSGTHRWVSEVGVPRLAQGEFLGYTGTTVDIHERRSMEDALRESEASFRDLADSAPVMIWTCDTRGFVTFVNDGWLRFTGTTLDQELGASWALGVHPDDVLAMQESWDEALAERVGWEFEYRLRERTGGYRWVVDRALPRFEAEAFVGYVGCAVDIHERKLMEGRLREVYEREHTIAETLQRSLLPERLPAIDGLALAARYLPAGSGSAVGGDWFDAFECPDGRVALIVGDVVGHGLRAAATMGQLRNAFRAYALLESSPGEVMARVNRMVRSGDGDAMATVLLLFLDRQSGEVSFCAAGHPPPLLIGPGGGLLVEGGRSVPIGASDSAAFGAELVTMPPGGTMLLYTDGLVERRDRPLEESLDELVHVASGNADDLDRLCDRILNVVLAEREPDDDVALLAVRPLMVGAERLSCTLPAEPDSLPLLRRRLGGFLGAAGASELERYEITLTVCEAAANAIEHAYGPGDAQFEVEVEVEVAVRGGRVIASVRDEGSWRERRGDQRGRGLDIMRGLMDNVDVAADREGTVVSMSRMLAGAGAV